jgi:cobalt-precorrin-5B (C1)-methyltransferase
MNRFEPATVYTDHLILRPPAASDAEAEVAAVDDEIRRWTVWSHGYTNAKTLHRCSGGGAGAAPPPGVHYGLIRGAPANGVVIKSVDHHPDVTRGIRSFTPASRRTRYGALAPVGGPMPHRMTEQTVGESVDLKVRGVHVAITIPGGRPAAGPIAVPAGGMRTTRMVRPFSTVSWRARVEHSVAAIAAGGEHTLVLYAGARTRAGAMDLLPKLPNVCFVAAGDFVDDAVRHAVEHRLTQAIVVGTAGGLATVATGAARVQAVPDLLAAITTDIGGSADLVRRIAATGTTRHACALWEPAALLGRAGRELCRRVAGTIEAYAAVPDATNPGSSAPRDTLGAPAAGALATQVVLVDATGRRMVAMYGRLAR